MVGIGSIVGLAGGAVGGIASAIGGRSSARRAAKQQRANTWFGYHRMGDALDGIEQSGAEAVGLGREALEDAQSLRSRVRATLDNAARAEVQRLQEARAARRAEVQQSLIGRGMFSSTVMDAIGRGVDRQTDAAFLDVGSRFAREQVTADLQTSANVQDRMQGLAQAIRATGLDAGQIKVQQGATIAGAPVIRTPSTLETFGQAIGSVSGALSSYGELQQTDDFLDILRGGGQQ